MIDFFCNIYSSIKNDGGFLEKSRINSLRRVAVRFCANLLLPLYFRLTKNNPEYRIDADGKTDVIVSLTSFPARINKVRLTIECLLRQTRKADKIILWLSKEQYPTSDSLPGSLLALIKRGLTIRLCEGDLRSHKKYTYTLTEYPHSTLITVDDDIFYRTTLIEDLLSASRLHPGCVIARYIHRIRYADDGFPLPYSEWEKNAGETHAPFFGSGGGTLFPPQSLYKDVTDTAHAILLCPNADDIWLNAMTKLNKTPIFGTGKEEILLPVIFRDKSRLYDSNMTDGNDRQLKKTMEYCEQTYRFNPFRQQ